MHEEWRCELDIEQRIWYTKHILVNLNLKRRRTCNIIMIDRRKGEVVDLELNCDIRQVES